MGEGHRAGFRVLLGYEGETQNHTLIQVRIFFQVKQPSNLTAWSGLRLPREPSLCEVLNMVGGFMGNRGARRKR